MVASTPKCQLDSRYANGVFYDSRHTNGVFYAKYGIKIFEATKRQMAVSFPSSDVGGLSLVQSFKIIGGLATGKSSLTTQRMFQENG